MTSQHQQLRDEIARLERNLQIKRTELAALERSCINHVWGDTQKTVSLVFETVTDYTNRSVHGIHIEYGTKQVSKEIPTWTRRCQCCGKIETTTVVAEEIIRKPKFPG